MSDQTLLHENKTYWGKRAPSYSQVNREELQNDNHRNWQDALSRHIRSHFPGKSFRDLKVLDIGTGPGFFAIVLAELGCQVTAVDFSASMLAEARTNAAHVLDSIRFLEMNAEALAFADHSFDVIVSRNLTWNLPHPEVAYGEWCRVLKQDGLLLNFDANWYHYLYDSAKRAEYEADRARSADLGIPDQNVGENFDAMETIAMQIPMSSTMRPAWDIRTLSSLNMSVQVDTTIWQQVWSKEEQVNFSSTPMFLIHATRSAGQTASSCTVQ